MTVIYFEASERYRRENPETCAQIIEHLGKYGNVDTKHLRKSNVLVAEVTDSSTSVGLGIGEVIEGNNWVSPHDQSRILCLYRSLDEELSQRVSRLANPVLAGNNGVYLRKYSNIEEARRHIDDFFKKRKPRGWPLL